MRCLILVVVSLFACTGVSCAADGPVWYALQSHTWECIEALGPAEVIQGLRESESPYTVSEAKIENGKPGIVWITCPEADRVVILFRTKALCDSASSKARANREAELNRYK